MSATTVDRSTASTALADAARLTALIASSLLAGAVLAVWLVDVALAAGNQGSLYISYRQATTGAFTATLPPLGGLALLAAAVSAVFGRGRARRFAVGAAACGIVGLAVTVLVHFPLNDQILTWSAAAPPPDWQQVRDRWLTAHVLRSLLTVAAFVLLALAGPTRRSSP